MKYVVVILSLMCAVSVFAQKSQVDKAVVAYKDGNISEARDFIDMALKDDGNLVDPKVWNFKGHIYKQIFKNNDLDPSSEEREIAVEAFKKSCELEQSGKYYEDNLKALKYFSATYFNHARQGAISVRYNAEETDPVVHFRKFKDLEKWLNPEADTSREELEFLKMIAQGFEKINIQSDADTFLYVEKAVEYYEKALFIDSTDYESNFNLAVVYYNEGAELISEINYTTGFSDLLRIQKECAVHFKNALPYMLKAEELRPNRVKSLKGLMYTYRALNDFDSYLVYKGKLDQILKN